jgi:F-type H+-transporting ATPase subunit b
MAHPTELASNNFLVPNATFIAEFIAFLLILGIIARYILPRIQGPLAERQAIIRKQMEDSDEAKRKLKEAEEKYKSALSEARVEAAQIREHARAEAQRTVEDVRAQASEESARILARGEELLATQRNAIVRELRAEIGTLAVELSEKIVDQQLADSSQVSATVDSFLAGLDAQDKAQSSAQSAGSPS